MKQLNTALFAVFTIIVLFAAAFAYDYFRTLEENTPSDMLDGPSAAQREEAARLVREYNAQTNAIRPAVESAERLDSVLRNNRSGLLDSAMPKPMRVEAVSELE